MVCDTFYLPFELSLKIFCKIFFICIPQTKRIRHLAKHQHDSKKLAYYMWCLTQYCRTQCCMQVIVIFKQAQSLVIRLILTLQITWGLEFHGSSFRR
ncbi:unnamed protein product [Chilo suppressalis]|uniref:Uncharacterized protein n=1 Tax=Chilo suppressalis TaxID=168631 RepID=A0ABN8EEW5_CHISP|nr:unnamed protein product [Chilo suppressalis]